jgi:phosphinothricin acetyltransferase
MSTIRPASAADLPALVEIYNHYVANSHFTFDVAPFTTTTRAPWFAQFDGARYRCLVAVTGDAVTGYANSAPLKDKPAYQTSVEVSIYLRPEQVGQGVGQRLYDALFDALAGEDVHRAYALIALPNPESMALHRRFGFSDAAHLTEVGRKFGRYWDVVWLEKKIGGA